MRPAGSELSLQSNSRPFFVEDSRESVVRSKHCSDASKKSVAEEPFTLSSFSTSRKERVFDPVASSSVEEKPKFESFNKVAHQIFKVEQHLDKFLVEQRKLLKEAKSHSKTSLSKKLILVSAIKFSEKTESFRTQMQGLLIPLQQKTSCEVVKNSSKPLAPSNEQLSQIRGTILELYKSFNHLSSVIEVLRKASKMLPIDPAQAKSLVFGLTNNAELSPKEKNKIKILIDGISG